MNFVTWLGAVLALLGILGLAIPVFTTSQTEDVIKLGDLKVQGTKTTSHAVPHTLSAGALVLGLVLIGAGVYSKRTR
jgi:selenophosphate synthase